MSRLRGLVVGAGYFARFHIDAWRRIDDVEIVGVCDLDAQRAATAAEIAGGASVFTNAVEAIRSEALDFVDIVTPPDSHLELVEACVAARVAIICQKPLAPTFSEAEKIVAAANDAGVPLMVHENFRFQPWHREIKRLLEADTIGKLHSLNFRTRMGDGWASDAYLDRQPYFRTMPRLLIYETGVHFLDTFRFLAGEVQDISAVLRRLNPQIAGEDTALVTMQFESGAVGVWDAGRFNESSSENPRLTFGEFLVEGDRGTLRLDCDARLFVKKLGQPEQAHPYQWNDRGFSGDCVRATQQHFVDAMRTESPFETNGNDYLKTLRLVEAAYESQITKRYVTVNQRRQLIDLSRPIDSNLPGVAIRTARSLETDGWNASTLELYSHCGTHMDAPRHFLANGAGIDDHDLAVCCGPARVVNLAPVAPRELITLQRFRAACSNLSIGERILLRTDWHLRYPSSDFRLALPRISSELASWLVEQRVALIGVEPPSVADVNNLAEVTQVHQILLSGGVTIIEGLVNLDCLCAETVDFIALPLRIAGGDGSPVRAIAIQ